MSLNQVASFFNLIDVIDFASVYFIPKIKGYFCKLDYVKNVLLQKIRYKKSSLELRSCLCSTPKTTYSRNNLWKTWGEFTDSENIFHRSMMRKSSLFHYLRKKYIQRIKIKHLPPLLQYSNCLYRKPP